MKKIYSDKTPSWNKLANFHSNDTHQHRRGEGERGRPSPRQGHHGHIAVGSWTPFEEVEMRKRKKYQKICNIWDLITLFSYESNTIKPCTINGYSKPYRVKKMPYIFSEPTIAQWKYGWCHWSRWRVRGPAWHRSLKKHNARLLTNHDLMGSIPDYTS